MLPQQVRSWIHYLHSIYLTAHSAFETLQLTLHNGNQNFCLISQAIYFLPLVLLTKTDFYSHWNVHTPLLCYFFFLTILHNWQYSSHKSFQPPMTFLYNCRFNAPFTIPPPADLRHTITIFSNLPLGYSLIFIVPSHPWSISPLICPFMPLSSLPWMLCTNPLTSPLNDAF